MLENSRVRTHAKKKKKVGRVERKTGGGQKSKNICVHVCLPPRKRAKTKAHTHKNRTASVLFVAKLSLLYSSPQMNVPSS